MTRALGFATLAALLTAGTPARAQLELERAPYRVVVEAYANATAGAVGDEDDARGAERFSGLLDTELRVLGLYAPGGDYAFGPRVTARGDSTAGRALGEQSLLLLTPGGRLELGRRRGLPDVLTGYGPNAYQFVSAEFGPASGRSLDPDGGLQTVLLAAPLAAQIGALASLGITASFFGDESDKLLYVSPKVGGFLGGASYAPDVETDARFDDLAQAGLVYEHYWQDVILRIGGSYAHAAGGTPGAGGAHDDLDSASAGGTLVLHDALTLGVSGTWNGDSGLPTGAPFAENAYGGAASVNYNRGRWTVGGFYQRARSAGDAFVAGSDTLDAGEVGLSYRTSTSVRLYGAGYRYRFDDENAAVSAGAVLLVGTRITL